MISIVAYGTTNLGSILNMLKKIGIDAKVVSRPEEILSADKLILPRVGAFDTMMLQCVLENYLAGIADSRPDCR